MMHDLADLVAGADIADRVGVTPAAVSNWRHRHDFPAPIVVVGRGNLPLFAWTEILAWLVETDRLPEHLTSTR